MKRTGKRIISFVLALALCLVMLPSVTTPIMATSTGLGEVKITGGQRDFLWPVPGVYKLTSCFLDPDANRTNSDGSKRLHYAIDIGAASGKSVVASYDGVVDGVGQNSSEGYWVRLKHSYKLATGETITLYTKYIHLKSYSVEKDQTVKKGEEIAKVGNTGASSGAHLDFQILTSTAKKSSSNSLDPYVNNLLELPAGIYYAGSCSCCKNYISTIKELYATPLSYLGQCTAYATHVTIKTTKSTYVKSLPCSEKTDTNSENVEVASAGAQYEAIGLYKNTAGNLWYKVNAKNGSVGYMYAGDTTFVSDDISDIVQSGITVPANHTQGNSYKLTGTVSSTYSKITKVSVYIYDAKGNNVTGDEASVTGNKYSFSGSAIDNKTKFGSLDVGEHTFKVTVYYEYCYADSATDMTTWSTAKQIYEKPFSVVSASCTHSYTSKITTAATCATAGVRTYTCSKCSDSYTESIAATGHSWKNATCTTAKTCSTCGTTSGSALGHSYNSGVITTAATCTTAGVKTYTCNTCAAKKTESIAATGHSWNSATCTAAKTCTTCGTTSGSALGHSYNSGVITTAATCTTAGVKTYTCSKCSDSYTESIAATGHSWKNATCTTAKTCSTCGTTSGSALGHSYNSGVITTAATCTTAGVKTYTCSKCSDSYTESIAATGHSWNSATCTAAKTCSTCGTTSGSALGHSYNAETTPPTCTEQGCTTHTCAVCGDSYKDSATNALGHNYSDGICTRCGADDPNYVADPNTLSIILESKKVTRGEEFTVTAEIKNNPGFSYLEITPVISSALTLVKVENGELISDFTKGKQYVWVSDENVTEDGVLLTFTLFADENVEAGNYQVSFNVRTCGNYDEEAVTLNVVAANIEVINHVYGDATGDGVVDGFDVIRLKKYLANYDYDGESSTTDVSQDADANGDGKIDGFDVIRLKKYLANYDYETGESTVVLGPQ